MARSPSSPFRCLAGRTRIGLTLLGSLTLLAASGCEKQVVNDGRYSLTGMNTTPTRTYAPPKPKEPTVIDHMVNPLRPVGDFLFGWIPSMPKPAPAPPPKPASTSYLGYTGKRATSSEKEESLGVQGGDPNYIMPR